MRMICTLTPFDQRTKKPAPAPWTISLGVAPEAVADEFYRNQLAMFCLKEFRFLGFDTTIEECLKNMTFKDEDDHHSVTFYRKIRNG